MMDVPAGTSQDRASQAYAGALRRAAWRRIAVTIRPRCNDLITAAGLFPHLDMAKREDLGLQEIPLARIIGSAGRHHDFDLQFQPRHRGSEVRWTSIAAAIEARLNLPPIQLYKIGDAYLVVDGHHRISVARAQGRPTLPAYVIEIDHSRLTPDRSCARLGFQHPGKTQNCQR